MATTTISIALHVNSGDAFVAWAPSAFIPGCRGFTKDKPKSGDHQPSSE